MMASSQQALQTSESSPADPTRAAASRQAFVTRAIARYRAAVRSVDEDPDVAAVAAVSGIAAEARRLVTTRPSADAGPIRTTATTPDGWVIAEAMDAIWLEIGPDVQDRFASAILKQAPDHDREASRAEHGERATEKMAYTQTYSNTDSLIRAALHQWDDASLGIASLQALRGAATDGDVAGMLRAINAYMSDEDIAEHLSNLTHPGVGGLGAVSPVYRRFVKARRAREAAEAGHSGADGDGLDVTPTQTAELEKLRAREQLARDEVGKHPIDVRKGAALLHADARFSATRSLDDFDGAERDQILRAIRGRLSRLGQQTILDTLRADPRDAGLLWGSDRDASLMVGTARGQMDRTMRRGGMLSGAVEMVSRSDNEASSRYMALAQGYQRVLADDTMSEEEREELARLQSEVEVSLAEFKAAKQAVADAVSTAAAAAAAATVTALVGVATGGVGAPIVAAILTTALAGSADVLIHEAVLGDDYDAEDAFAEVCVDVLQTAITAQLSRGWELSKLAVHAKLLESSQGRGLIESVKVLQRATRGSLGELGLNLAGAGVDAATTDVKDAALAMLDPGMYEHGWDHGLRVGLEGFEDTLMGLPAASKDAILAELASQLGEMAGSAAQRSVDGTPRSAAGPDAFGHGANNPLAPDPRQDPKKYREYLVARLKTIPGTTVKEAVSDGVSGLSLQLVREGEEYLLHGDVDMDIDAFVDEVKDAGKTGLKTGRKALMQSFTGARKDKRKAEKDEQIDGQHRQRLQVLEEIDHGLSGDELAQFAAWASSRVHDPLGGGIYGDKDRMSFFPDLGIELNKAMDTSGNKQATREAAVRMDLAAFRTEVLDPLHGQLDRHRRQSDLSDGELDAYEAWVMDDPSAISERVKTAPTDFVRRRDSAREALDGQRDSAAYASLSTHERAWFDHAAERPDLLADLTQDGSGLAISLKTPRDVQAFQDDLKATQQTLSSGILDELKQDFAASQFGVSDEDAFAFIEREKEAIVAGVELDPRDGGANRLAVRRRLDAAWVESREASILDRLVATGG